MHKQKQLFYFFAINDVPTFKSHLASDIAPVVASVSRLLNVSSQPLVALNIAFSQTGLTKLGVTDNLGDSFFTNGQAANTTTLLGETMDNWIPQFKTRGIHGVILLASDVVSLLDQQVTSIELTFGASMVKVYSLAASIRPGAEAGHESASGSSACRSLLSCVHSVWVPRRNFAACHQRIQHAASRANRGGRGRHPYWRTQRFVGPRSGSALLSDSDLSRRRGAPG